MVAEPFDTAAAETFGLASEDVVVTIHCGSRGLGHQIGTDYLKEMVVTAAAEGIALPDRELACAPIRSEVGQRYLGAMRAATNCALAKAPPGLSGRAMKACPKPCGQSASPFSSAAARLRPLICIKG